MLIVNMNPADDNSGGMGSVDFGVNEQVGTYTILIADRGQYVRYTGASNGAWTVPAATTFADGFGVFISTNAFQLTLTRSGADTINGGYIGCHTTTIYISFVAC